MNANDVLELGNKAYALWDYLAKTGIETKTTVARLIGVASCQACEVDLELGDGDCQACPMRNKWGPDSAVKCYKTGTYYRAWNDAKHYKDRMAMAEAVRDNIGEDWPRTIEEVLELYPELTDAEKPT